MKTLQSPRFPHNKPNSKPTSLGKKRAFSDISPENYTWWRKGSALKTKPTTKNDKIKKTPLHKKCNNGGEGEGEKTQKILSIFRAKIKELSNISISERGFRRIDCMAMQELKKEGLLPKKQHAVKGSIPGIEIGDTFSYRVELMIAGIHSRTQHGIDFCGKGKDVIATCIVSTEGYNDKMSEIDVLTYVGEGGMYGCKEGECPNDQKMEMGNLALKNSCEVGNDVRVVKGFKDCFGTKISYVYDGLYKVVDCLEKRGFMGNLLFEFKLKRNPNQTNGFRHKFKNMVR